MAQTKRKRRTKHRGNAAGVVEARGRTGRKPTAAERKLDAKEEARLRRQARMDRPPSWRGSINRAAIAAIFFVLLAMFILDAEPAQAISLGAFMLLLYVPMGYYTDMFIYRRRQRNKAKEGKA